MAKVIAVCISDKKGMRKKDVGQSVAICNHGFKNDAHAADWHRQISLLAIESIEKMRQAGLDVGPGDFAENITTEGIDLVNLPVGTVLNIGEALLEVTQIGKVCHNRCAIYYQAGDCVMPKEGIFVKVIKNGLIKNGDSIRIVEKSTLKDAGA